MIYDDDIYIYTWSYDHICMYVWLSSVHYHVHNAHIEPCWLARWGLEEEKRQALALLVGCSSVGVPPRLEKPGCKKMSWEMSLDMNTMMVFKQENMGIIGDVEVMAYHRCHHRSEIRWSVGDSPHYDSAFSGLRWFPHCPWFKPIWIAKMEIGWTIPKCLKPPNSYHTYSTLPFHIVVQSPFLLVVTSPFRSHFFCWLLPADHLQPQAYHIGGYISHCIPIVVGLFWLSNPGSRAFWFVKKHGAPRMVYGFACAYSSTWC